MNTAVTRCKSCASWLIIHAMIRYQNLYTDVYNHDVVSKVHTHNKTRVAHTIFRISESAHVGRQNAHSYKFDGCVITTPVVRCSRYVDSEYSASVSSVFTQQMC